MGPDEFLIECEHRWNDLVDNFMGISWRLGCLSMGWPRPCELDDLGSFMPMLTYSAVAWGPVLSSAARKERTLVNVLSGSKVNARRCLEVALELLSPVHRCSIQEALLHEQVAILCRLLNTASEMQDAVKQRFEICAAMDTPSDESFCEACRKCFTIMDGHGPIGVLAQILLVSHIHW